MPDLKQNQNGFTSDLQECECFQSTGKKVPLKKFSYRVSLSLFCTFGSILGFYARCERADRIIWDSWLACGSCLMSDCVKRLSHKFPSFFWYVRTLCNKFTDKKTHLCRQLYLFYNYLCSISHHVSSQEALFMAWIISAHRKIIASFYIKTRRTNTRSGPTKPQNTESYCAVKLYLPSVLLTDGRSLTPDKTYRFIVVPVPAQRLAASDFSRPSFFLFQSVLQFLIFSLACPSFFPGFKLDGFLQLLWKHQILNHFAHYLRA